MSEHIASDLLQKWVKTVQSGDPKQITELYENDALLLGTFSDKERFGHELIFEYFENLLKSDVDVKIISERPIDNDKIAVNSGFYNFIVDGKTIEARFSFIFHSSNSEWKILSDHSSIVPKN